MIKTKVSSDKYKKFYHRLFTLSYDPIGNSPRWLEGYNIYSFSPGIDLYKTLKLSPTFLDYLFLDNLYSEYFMVEQEIGVAHTI